MSVTIKQLTANRRNARKSTGPKTPEGKRRSGHNSAKHGLYARDTVITCPTFKENRAAFVRLLEDLLQELMPATTFETHLVRKIATCLWRSRRLLRAETAYLNRQMSGVDRAVASNVLSHKYLAEPGEHNINYLKTKKARFGHLLDEDL